MSDTGWTKAVILPTAEEYAHIREVAEMHINRAEQESGEELGVSVDFPCPTDHWSFRIHVYEKSGDPDERKRWKYEGTIRELEEGIAVP